MDIRIAMWNMLEPPFYCIGRLIVVIIPYVGGYVNPSRNVFTLYFGQKWKNIEIFRENGLTYS